jgi:hypothetical protein
MRCVSLTDIRFWRELKMEAAETRRIHLGRSSAGISTRQGVLREILHADMFEYWKSISTVRRLKGYVGQGDAGADHYRPLSPRIKSTHLI